MTVSIIANKRGRKRTRYVQRELVPTDWRYQRYIYALGPFMPDSPPELIIAVGRIIDRWRLYPVRHINNPLAIAVPDDELRELLGRDWREQCEDIIWTEGGYRFMRGKSSDGSYTRELHVNPIVAKQLELHRRNPPGQSEAAQVSNDRENINRRVEQRHRNRKKSSPLELPDAIAIDMDAMDRIRVVYEDWMLAIESQSMPSLNVDGYVELYERKRGSALHKNRSMDDFARDWERMISRREMIANTIINRVKDGLLLHPYEQRNGKPRYTNIGAESLLICPREIRYAAMNGQHGYDINACHHFIIHHFAMLAGIDCPELSELVAGKEPYRQKISDETGGVLSVSEAKLALLMIVYGSRFHDAALVDAGDKKAAGLLLAFGEHGQNALSGSESFMKLRSELNRIFDWIIEHHKPGHGARGGYRNALGQYLRPEPGETRKRSSIVAFILQAIEVQAMLAMVKASKTARLSVYDGIVCAERENIEALEQAMFEATGIRFELEPGEIKATI